MQQAAPDWRQIDGEPSGTPGEPHPARSIPPSIIALAGAAGVVIVAIAAFLVLSTPTPRVIVQGSEAGGPLGSGMPGDGPASSAQSSTPDWVLVDVSGGVSQPGLYRLPAGSRVGDAIASAGGFGPRVDADAATAALNLAQPLTDGEKVAVPLLGTDGVPAAGPPTALPGGASPAGGGIGAGGPPGSLINLNAASQVELEELPGIGPVTAAEIIAARGQAPFASVDELRSRGVVGPSTFEKIRALVSVGP
ncbi:MAG: ComEA family DNA-binding protein [Chloroflexi bacterium]|nr:ComEA family DNA-binding protein [Chloroflexota bacterium]